MRVKNERGKEKMEEWKRRMERGTLRSRRGERGWRKRRVKREIRPEGWKEEEREGMRG